MKIKQTISPNVMAYLDYLIGNTPATSARSSPAPLELDLEEGKTAAESLSSTSMVFQELYTKMRGKMSECKNQIIPHKRPFLQLIDASFDKCRVFTAIIIIIIINYHHQYHHHRYHHHHYHFCIDRKVTR